MHTMDACLRTLFEQGIITFEDAMTQVKNVEEFKHLLERKKTKK